VREKGEKGVVDLNVRSVPLDISYNTIEYTNIIEIYLHVSIKYVNHSSHSYPNDLYLSTVSRLNYPTQFFNAYFDMTTEE